MVAAPWWLWAFAAVGWIWALLNLYALRILAGDRSPADLIAHALEVKRRG